MSRLWLVGVGVLVVGAGVVLWATMGSHPSARPPVHKERARFFDQGFVSMLTGPTSPAMQKLQWLADESGCPASDNPALMASCIRHKLWKGRDKAR